MPRTDEVQQILDRMEFRWNNEVKLILNLARASDCSGTLLHRAAVVGNDDIARPPIDLGSPDDRKLIVRILLEAEANIDSVDVDDEAALHDALDSEMENFKIVEAFLLRARAETPSTEELIERLLAANCPFAYFVLLRDVDILGDLLQRGFDANCCENFAERSALHFAVLINDSELAELLVARGADVNTSDACEGEPLYYAAKFANSQMLRFLLDHGADPEPEVSFVGQLPLSAGLINGESDDEQVRECAELLLERGDYSSITRSFVEELQMFYDEILQTSRLNCLVAHQAGLDAIEEPDHEDEQHLTKVVEFKEYYQKCRKILEVVVAGKMTLIQLLYDKYDHETRLRARDIAFVRQLEQFCAKLEMEKSFSYYARVLTSQIVKAVRAVELEKKASLVVCALFKCDYNQLSICARKVAGYLSERELEELCRV